MSGPRPLPPVTFQPSGVTRIGIIHDATDADQDSVASIQSGVKRELTRAWLERGFQHVFVLSGNRFDFCGEKRVTCLGNSNAERGQVLSSLLAAGFQQQVDWSQVDIVYLQHGHGDDGFVGGQSLQAFASQWNQLPKEAQRIFIGVQCHAASILAQQEMADDNDLLMTLSGRGKQKSPNGPTPTQSNYTDTADLGFISSAGLTYAQDPILCSHQEMFFRGQIYYLHRTERPLHRGFVFLKGENFKDRGFCDAAGKNPFSSQVQVFSSKEEVAKVVKILMDSYEKGITVVGLAPRFGTAEETNRAYEIFAALASEHAGAVQFLWLQGSVSWDFAMPFHIQDFGAETKFIFFYPGADSERSFNVDEVTPMLHDILTGVNMWRE